MPHEKIVHLFKNADSISINDSKDIILEISPDIGISSEELELLEEKRYILDKEENKQSTVIQFVLDKNNLSSIGIYLKLEHFIKRQKFQEILSTASSIYIYDKVDFPKETLIERHNKLLYFIEALSSISIYHKLNASKEKIQQVFAGEKTCTIDAYTSEEIINLCSPKRLAAFEYLTEILIKNDKSDKRWILFHNELIETLSSLDDFALFIKDIINFKERCDASYHHYMANYKYSKIKYELDMKSVELSAKIKEVVNDSKILYIPSAFLLIVPNLSLDGFTYKNMAIGFTTIVFAIFIHFFLAIQSELLKGLYSLVAKFENDIRKTKNHDLITKHRSDISNFKTSINNQDYILVITNVIIWALPVIVFVVVFYGKYLELMNT